MFWLYNLLLTLTAPFWGPWMWWRARRRKEQPKWEERFGNFDLPKRGDRRRIWFHAVSVGEVVAALPILRELRKALPNHEIVLSVTTSSGHQTARDRAAGLYDHLVYFPIDVARFQLAGMQRVRPDVVVVMETELWFNFLWAARVFEARTLLVNGRISDRSFPRSMKARFFYRALLGELDRALMQSPVDAERIQALGAREAAVLGNCKFDEAVEGLDADPDEWRAKLGLTRDLPVVVVGSTRGEEEERLVLEGLRLVGFDRMQVVHAPRHLERVPALAEAVRATTGGVALRSRSETGPYLVLDTYGELSRVYAVADVVIVGGGFANLGGQNIVQPLAHGKPVLHGPHMQNFRDVAQMAVAAGASERVNTAENLAEELRHLLEKPELRASMGEAARELVQANVGASARYAKAIAEEAVRSKAR